MEALRIDLPNSKTTDREYIKTVAGIIITALYRKNWKSSGDGVVHNFKEGFVDTLYLDPRDNTFTCVRINSTLIPWYEAIEGGIPEAKKEVEETQGQIIERLTGEVKELSGRNEILKFANDKWEKAYPKLKEENEKLSKSYTKHISIVYDLEERNKALNDSCDNHEKVYLELDERYDDSLKKIEGLNSSIEGHKERYIETIEEVRDEVGKSKRLQSRLDQIKLLAYNE